MFFLRLTLATALAILATSDASAQLFRFRQRAQRAPQQVPQTPSRFNPSTYQYNQLPQPQTNVPSTRYAVQPQATNLRQVAGAKEAAANSKANTQPNAQRVVMLTLRDPRTGRLFQRPYLVNDPQPAATAKTQQPKVATLPMKPIEEDPQSSDSLVAVETPVEAPRSVALTTFESPVLDPVEPETKEEFSIFDEPSDATPADSNFAPELGTPEPASTAVVPDASLESTQASTPAASTVEPVLAPRSTEPTLELELELDEPASVVPNARTQTLPFDSAGELDLDIEFAPLNSPN